MNWQRNKGSGWYMWWVADVGSENRWVGDWAEGQVTVGLMREVRTGARSTCKEWQCKRLVFSAASILFDCHRCNVTRQGVPCTTIYLNKCFATCCRGWMCSRWAGKWGNLVEKSEGIRWMAVEWQVRGVWRKCMAWEKWAGARDTDS